MAAGARGGRRAAAGTVLSVAAAMLVGCARGLEVRSPAPGSVAFLAPDGGLEVRYTLARQAAIKVDVSRPPPTHPPARTRAACQRARPRVACTRPSRPRMQRGRRMRVRQCERARAAQVFGFADPNGWPGVRMGSGAFDEAGVLHGSVALYDLSLGAVRIRCPCPRAPCAPCAPCAPSPASACTHGTNLFIFESIRVVANTPVLLSHGHTS
jgi:hypothetical protein